jgi:hypothetical protein
MAQVTRYREGNVTVTVGPELQEWVDRCIRECFGGAVERIEHEVQAVYDQARKDWPVRTGRSRDGLRTSLTLDRTRGRVEGAVLAMVPYSIYIKPYKLRGKTTAWQAYVRGPITQAKKRLMGELGPVIVGKVAKKRGRG